MLADSKILNLPKVSLETKDLLPEYSGIYYVVDEKQIVWYIGKAKNICKRWQGKAHHRIYQLKHLKHKYFNIYYEQINFSQLDRREKQQIKKYNPHLNNSPVKSKKIRPTETLLRETIATISDFAFILGVEPPRREIKDRIGIAWLIQEQILDLPIIHICLDLTAFKATLNPQSVNEHQALIKKAFSTRKAYASKWEGFPKGYPFMFRLNVNGHVIEVNDLSVWVGKENIENTQKYNDTKIAKESFKVVTPESLFTIQNYNLEQQSNKIRLQRIKPYTSDLIPLLFNESVDTEAVKQKFYKFSEDHKTGKRGVGSRCCPIKSRLINSDFTTIDELLISRGINNNQYDENNIISMKRGMQDRIGLYIQCFNLDPKSPCLYAKTTDGSKVPVYNPVMQIVDNQKITSASCKFDIVYLLASVDEKAWLLVENYLKDFAFAHKKFNNKEGFIDKFYVSPRKFISPAKVNIKLTKMRYSVWIPFGMSEQYSTFEAAKQEITRRLNEADLPELKLTFRKENITK